MAGLSFSRKLNKLGCGLGSIIVALTLAACGTGDGPEPTANSPATPLPPLPPGFCDPINFEILCELPGILNFNIAGLGTDVVDNPDQSGINDSDKVARMRKGAEATFGGTRLNLLETPVDFSGGESYKVKVWSERPVPVTFKLEETTNGTLGIEKVDTHDGGSVWQELCFDFTAQTPANTIAYTLIFDNGTESNMLMRSLQRALNKDEAGRRPNRHENRRSRPTHT